jgi:hypothetical protein
MLQTLGIERHADPIVPEDLHQITALAPEHVEVPRVRIALQRLLHLERQAVHTAPHVGVPTASQTRTAEGTAITDARPR